MTAYYNEFDPFAAAWLRELIKDGLIADGEVDERSIKDVAPGDLGGFTQLHFFAGIGGWSLALRMAGWPDDRAVATASAPCQPYSVASVAVGGAQGSRDSRDLWPDTARILGELDVPDVLGEQVSDAISWGWFDRTASDLERQGYAVAAAVLRADAYGARHRRNRLVFGAHASGARWARHKPIECVSITAPTTLPEYGDPLTRAWSALDGDFDGLLHCDGLSVVMERHALKGYGNAIVPQVAAEFIRAYLDVTG